MSGPQRAGKKARQGHGQAAEYGEPPAHLLARKGPGHNQSRDYLESAVENIGNALQEFIV